MFQPQLFTLANAPPLLTPYHYYMMQHCFVKMGVAGTCVFGNLCTAVVTGLLLMIGNLPPTELAFGFFVAVMYGGFPFTGTFVTFSHLLFNLLN